MTSATASSAASVVTQNATTNTPTRYIKNGTFTKRGIVPARAANPYNTLSDFLEGDE